MKAVAKEERRLAYPFVLIFLLLAAGIAPAALGLLTLLGWVLELPRLASFGTNLIPMAPSTAFLFLLYGVAVCLRARTPLSHGTIRISVVLVGVGTMIALLLFTLGCLNIQWSVEHPGLSVSRMVGGAPIGHMSPVAAFCFLLAGAAFLVSLTGSALRPWRVVLGLGFAGVLVGTCFVFLLAYLYGEPLLYGGTFIPPALNTTIAFVVLGIGLLALVSWQVGLTGGLPGDGPRTTFAFILIFALLAAGIVTVAYRSYRNFERHYYSETERQLSAIAELKVDELMQYRKERLENAGIFLNNDGFSILVKRFISNPDDVDAQWQIQEWADKFMVTDQYDHIRLLDVKGVTRLSSPVGLPQVTFVAQRIPQVLGSDQVTFRDLHLNEIDHRAYLNIMVPIFEEQDVRRPLGVFYLRIDPEKHLYPIIQRWPTPSRTAETLLVRRDGNDALYLNDLRFQTNAALNLRASLVQTNVVAVRAVLGSTGIMQGADYRGVRVIAAVRAVPDSSWILVAKIDMAEVYAPLRERLKLVIVLVGLLLVGAGLGVGVIWRHQRVKFYKEQYRITEALRESEERLRSHTDNSPMAVIEWNAGLIITRWTGAAEKMFGWRAEEAVGKSITELPKVYEEDLPSVQNVIKQLTDGVSKHVVASNRNRTRDGRVIHCEWYSSVLHDGGGKIISVLSQVLDITERKQAEKELRESQVLYYSLVEQLPVGIFRKSPDGRYVLVNPWFCRLKGMKVEEFLGRTPEEVAAGEAAKRDPIGLAVKYAAAGGGHHEQIMRTGKPIELEEEYTDAAGKKQFVHAMKLPVFDPDGKVIGSQGILLDITEIKQAADKVRVSEIRLRTLVQTIPDLVWLKDANGVFLSCNPAFERMIGVGESAIIGKTDYDFVDKSLADFFRQRDQAAMAADEPTTNEEWLTFVTDGYCGLFQTIKTPVHDAAGALVGVLGVARDITGIRRAEEASRVNQEWLLKVITQTRCILNSGHVEGPADWRERAMKPESPFRWDFPVQNEETAQKILPLELAPGELYQQAWTRSRNRDDHTQMNWNSGNAFLNDLPFYRNEFRCTDKHGVRHWMQQFVTVRKLSENRWEVFGITTDISDLKRVEEELRESQALYLSLVNQIPAGVFRKDAKGRYVFVNPVFCRLKGTTPDKYLGKTSSELETPDAALAARGASHHATIMQTGDQIEDDEVDTGSDGGPRNYHVVKTPVLDFAGKIVGTQGILFDNTELMQATQRVADALNFNQTVLRSSPVGIVVFKASGPCVSANEVVGQIAGGTREEILKQNFRELESWKNSGMLAAADDALAAQAERSLETQSVTTFGRKAWFSCRFAPFRYQGEPHLLLAINDVTERKQAEATLRRSEEMLQRSQYVARLGHYVLNAVSGDWTSSETLNEVLGIDAAFKKNVASWSKLVYPEERDAMVEYFQVHVLKGRNPFDKEYRIVRPNDGSIRWVHGIGELRFNASGEVVEMFGTIQDITERKEVEQALRWGETQLQVILESTADGILAVDGKGKVIAANQRFAELWRVPQSVMDTKDDRTLLDFAMKQLSDPDTFLKKVQSLYHTDTKDMETLVFKDGRIFERYSFPMIMDGAVIGRVWSFRDITARKRQEKELSEKNTELERFTYTVSHDLKSPLVTVKTFLGYLEQDLAGTDKERVRQDVAYMHSAADKMGLLLDELLNLARVGRKSNPAERVTFKEIAQETIRLVAGRISTGGAAVQVADAAVVLEGDRPRLMEIWQNLVENACKFMGNQPNPRVEIGVEKRGSETVFFVRDNGAGIDPRFQAKVFGLFEKLDPKGEGTGMGLALVKRIVELYKGRIWVESPGLGQGANFLFTLPEAVIIDLEQSS